MFKLPSNVNHLFSKPLKEIKSHGGLISKSATQLFLQNGHNYCKKEDLFSLFDNTAFAEMFFYNFDNYVRVSTKLEKLIVKKASIASTNKSEALEAKVSAQEQKIKRIEIAAHKRLMNHKYCKRKLVSLVMSEMLYHAQEHKSIGAGKASYAPDILVKFRKLQQEYNAEFLASRAIVINGTKKTLASVATGNTKKISELYAKVKGFETIAKENGMSWAFLTLTAPGEYHPNPTTSRKRSYWNKKNARSAHAYLTDCWKKFGKACAKKGISMSSGDFFGMRVTEPHQDGCPHWHVVCFYAPELENLLFDQDKGLLSLKFGHSSRAIDIKFGNMENVGNEGVASAASYCFKYLTKAICGDIDDIVTKNSELETELQSNAIARIESWRASTNIRAYQTFGVSGVSTLWNTIRKVSSKTGLLLKHHLESSKTTYSVYQAPFDAGKAQLELETLIDDETNFKLSISQYESVKFEAETLGISEAEFEVDYSEPTYFEPQDPHSDEAHFQKELEMTLDLNDFSSGFLNGLYVQNQFRQLMTHAVAGDWASFYRRHQSILSSADDDQQQTVTLVKESYRNQYGESVKKVIGINTGMWVYLFKQYEVVSVQK